MAASWRCYCSWTKLKHTGCICLGTFLAIQPEICQKNQRLFASMVAQLIFCWGGVTILQRMTNQNYLFWQDLVFEAMKAKPLENPLWHFTGSQRWAPAPKMLASVASWSLRFHLHTMCLGQIGLIGALEKNIFLWRILQFEVYDGSVNLTLQAAASIIAESLNKLADIGVSIPGSDES